MSSPAVSAQEVQEPSTLTSSAQIKDLDVGGQTGSPNLPTNASPSRKPLSVTTSDNVAPTNPPLNVTGGPSPVVGLPNATGSPAPRVPNPGNDALQDSSRSSILSSPHYNATPFSYNMFPRAGAPQHPPPPLVGRLIAPMSPAALQPPVPGQPSGARPFFSYNVVPRANLSPAPGQQFQPTTVTNQPDPQRQITHPSICSSQSSASVQSMCINSNTSGTQTLSVPSQITVDTVADHVNGPSTQVNPESTQSTTTIFSSSGIPLSNPASVPRPVGPNFHMPPGMPGISGMSVPSGSRPLAPSSSNVTSRPMVPDFCPTSQKPVVPSSSTTATNPVSFPAQQQICQPYPSLHALAPQSQASWVHSSQSGAVQHPPFPGAVPVLSPSPFHTEAPPATLPNIKPPGIPIMPTLMGKPSSSLSVSQSTGTLATQLPPPGVDHDKQANSLPNIAEGMTKKEVADVWTMHKTEAGVVYYYNALTRESTYEKPAGYKLEQDKILANPTPVSWEKLQGTDWVLVRTNDKKNYYYDTKNKFSSWQLPPDVAELMNNQDNKETKADTVSISNASAELDKGHPISTLSTPALQTGGRDASGLRSSSTPVSSSALDLVKKKLQDTSGPTTSPLPATSVAFVSNSGSPRSTEDSTKGQYIDNNKEKVKGVNGDGNFSDTSSDSEDTDTEPSEEECVIQFKEMLKERGIAPFSKWDKELPKIVFDPRFKAVPSHATRRTLFEHYVRTRAEEERKEKRAAQKAAIEGFKKLLEEASEDLNKRTDYQTFKRKWGNDSRFEALDRKDRELLFNERVLYLKKAAEEKIQATRAVLISDFKSMLKERGDITPSSRWSRVKDSFRNDPRYRSINRNDREILFSEFLSELKAVENEAERTAKAKREEQEKLKRREQEMLKRKQREEQEMESLKLKVRRKEAEASYQALLVETIKDPKASWTESKPRLEKDPQGRFTNSTLDLNEMERLFREHVKNLYERGVHDFRALLAELITTEAATKATDQGKTVFTSWSEAKGLIKHDVRYSKLSSKDREKLWLRHVEDMTGKRNSVSNDRMEIDRKSRTTADHPRRSPRSRSRR